MRSPRLQFGQRKATSQHESAGHAARVSRFLASANCRRLPVVRATGHHIGEATTRREEPVMARHIDAPTPLRQRAGRTEWGSLTRSRTNSTASSRRGHARCTGPGPGIVDDQFGRLIRHHRRAVQRRIPATTAATSPFVSPGLQPRHHRELIAPSASTKPLATHPHVLGVAAPSGRSTITTPSTVSNPPRSRPKAGPT